jgi:hypothetical protein
MSLDNKTAPMPPGVQDMSKEQLWDWFQRSTRAHQELNWSTRRFWSITTGLHGVHVERGVPSPYEAIELQRARIKGLELQMAQMHKGYRKKIAKLEAERNALLGKLQSLRAQTIKVLSQETPE